MHSRLYPHEDMYTLGVYTYALPYAIGLQRPETLFSRHNDNATCHLATISRQLFRLTISGYAPIPSRVRSFYRPRKASQFHSVLLSVARLYGHALTASDVRIIYSPQYPPIPETGKRRAYGRGGAERL